MEVEDSDSKIMELGHSVQVRDVKQVAKHGNIVTNLLKSNLERNLQDHEEDNPWIDPEVEISTEKDESDLIICYEPLDENDVDSEESLMGESFKLLESFFLSYPDLLKEAMLDLENQQKPKVYKTYLRKCRICQRAFKNQKDLDDHKQLHFQMDRSFRCKTCRKLFFDIRNLKNHEKIHVRENSKCKVCLKEFRVKKYLDQHMVQHHKPSKQENQDVLSRGSSAYPCQQCGKVFRSKAKLDDHDTIHSGFKPYNCNLCGKAFLAQESLKQHMVNHKEEVIKLYNCEYCLQKFYFLGKITEHMTKVHPDVFPYTCGDCGLKFGRSESLDIHEKSHVNKQEVPICTICDKSYQTNFTLKRHMAMFHEEEGTSTN